MCVHFAGFFPQTPRGRSAINWAVKKLAWNRFQASQLNAHQPCALVMVVITLVMLVIAFSAVVVRPTSTVICSVIWITPVIAVIAARIITISISGIAVPVCGVTESDSDRADSNRNLGISLFHRNQSQADCY